jgi:hypothetical protein
VERTQRVEVIYLRMVLNCTRLDHFKNEDIRKEMEIRIKIK